MVQVDNESGLDGKTVLKELHDAGHDYAPDKQRVRLRLAGQQVTLYRMQDGRAVLLPAEQTDHYVDKGAFAVSKPSAAEIRKWRKDNGYEEVHLGGVDNDEQPGDQVDPPDKFGAPKRDTTRKAKAVSTPPAAEKVQGTPVPPAPSSSGNPPASPSSGTFPSAGRAGTGITTSEDMRLGLRPNREHEHGKDGD